MIEVTEKAAKQLRKFLAMDEGKKIRVKEFSTGCGWSSLPELGVTLDELREKDIEQEVDGIPFVIAEELAKRMDEIKVDFKASITGKKFIVTSSTLQACTFQAFNTGK